ncbi:hypothetical protein AX15_003061 [Amanita polypyramis BW_CC]|nr:hypothetical protein AX15_003061 [Amanita polypyramis BW_CC]
MLATPSLPESARKLNASPPIAAARNLLNFPLPLTSKITTIEASLAPFKYATFAVLGYTALRQAGLLGDSDTAVWVLYAKCGLIGGAFLAILYLLPVNAAEMEDRPSSNMLYDQLTLIVREMIYSAAAAFTGSLTAGVASRSALQMMMVGATGALVSFVFLYTVLGAVVGTLWVIMKCYTRTRY